MGCCSSKLTSTVTPNNTRMPKIMPDKSFWEISEDNIEQTISSIENIHYFYKIHDKNLGSGSFGSVKLANST